MPSHAVGLSQVRSPAIVMHRARWILRRKVARTRAVELHQLALELEEGGIVAGRVVLRHGVGLLSATGSWRHPRSPRGNENPAQGMGLGAG